MAVKEKRSEALVGLFLVIGVSLLGLLIILFGDIEEYFKDRYPIEVEFQDATGVIKGSQVLIGGAQVGEVGATPYLTTARRARVPLLINEAIRIPSEAVFQISSVSLLGDKAIVITLPETLSKETIQPGSLLQGGSAAGLEAIQSDAVAIASDARILMADAKTSLMKIDSSLDEFRVVTARLAQSIETINTGLLHEENQKGIATSIAQFAEASQQISESSKLIKPLFQETQQLLVGLKETNQKAHSVLVSVHDTVEDVEPALAQLPETMKSFRQTSEKAATAIDQITGKDSLLEAFSGDHTQMKEDARVFIKNLRQYGILGYRDEQTSEKINPETDRYRGHRR